MVQAAIQPQTQSRLGREKASSVFIANLVNEKLKVPAYTYCE
jgi:hypothetical protein